MEGELDQQPASSPKPRVPAATVGAVSKRFLPALLDARYGVDNRLFPGEIIVTEMKESLQAVEMDRMN